MKNAILVLVLVLGGFVATGGGTPTVSSLSDLLPTDGATTTVTVSGSNFDSSQPTVTINSYQCSLKEYTSSAIVCVLSGAVGVGINKNVVVTVGVSSATTAVACYKVPTIKSLTPMASDYQGTTVSITLSGANFGNAATAANQGSCNSVNIVSHYEAVCVISPPGTTQHSSLSISTDSGASDSYDGFSWVDLTLSTVSPSTVVEEGDTITIDGAYFGGGVASSTVTVGGYECDSTVYSSTTRLVCAGVPACGYYSDEYAVAVAIDTVASTTTQSLASQYATCTPTSSSWTGVGNGLLSLFAAIVSVIVAQSAIVGCLGGFVGGGLSGMSGAAAGTSSGLSSVGNGLGAAGQTALGGLTSLIFQMQGVALLSYMNVRLPSALNSISGVMSWLTLAGDMGIRSPSVLSASSRRLAGVVTIEEHGSDVLLMTVLTWTLVLMTAVGCFRCSMSCFFTVCVRWVGRLREVKLDPLFWFPKFETLVLLVCYQAIAVSVCAVFYSGSPFYRAIAVVIFVVFLLGWPAGIAIFLSHHIHSRKKAKYRPHRVFCCIRLQRAWHALTRKHVCRRNGSGQAYFPYNIIAWLGEVEFWLFNMGEWEFLDVRFEKRYDSLFSDYSRTSYLFLPADMLMMVTKCLVLTCVTGWGETTHYSQLSCLILIDGARLIWVVLMFTHTDGLAGAVDIYSNFGAILASACALGMPLKGASENASTLEELLGAFMTAITLSTLTNKILVQLLKAIVPLLTLLAALATRPTAWLRIALATIRTMCNALLLCFHALTCECICRWSRRRMRRKAKYDDCREIVWSIVDEALVGCVDPGDPLYQMIGLDSSHMFMKDIHVRLPTPADSEYTFSASDQSSEVSRSRAASKVHDDIFNESPKGPEAKMANVHYDEVVPFVAEETKVEVGRVVDMEYDPVLPFTHMFVGRHEYNDVPNKPYVKPDTDPSSVKLPPQPSASDPDPKEEHKADSSKDDALKGIPKMKQRKKRDK